MKPEAGTALGDWFAGQGWTPADFQRATWAAYLAGRSGLVHSATGSGKSLAAWGGPLLEGLARADHDPPLRVLWVTPLRALASDTVTNLQAATDGVGLRWRVEKRTGDTGASARARQRRRPPAALVTTPESLSLLLSYRRGGEAFRGLRAVVVDEWHELLGSKRGVQLELCLARLRALAPGLRVWGLSATLGNTAEAQDVLLAGDPRGELIRGSEAKRIRIRGLLPGRHERFPWAGHLGVSLLPQVLEHLGSARSCLLFTNTRSQAELWFEAILRARSDWLEGLGLHHGSIDRALRDRIEAGLREGRFRCVVATSSLDLGVDFSPVDRVVQVGSPKGVARLAQRAGRCGHQPGAESEVLCVPSHALELVEIAAARRAWDAGRIEGRTPLRGCLDVLAQHLVTLAAGDGFQPEALLAEVRTTHAYRDLGDEAWQWVLDFVTGGGPVLAAYPDFRRVLRGDDGRYRIAGRAHAARHRMSIGTITSDAAIAVRFQGGGHLGTIEESFISRLRPGDTFLFAGRALELVRVRDLTAYVRRARGSRRAVPRWQGGRLPLSTELADGVREILAEVRAGHLRDPETRAVADVLAIQQRWSALPGPGELLAERVDSREGAHLFLYPFAGRLVHEGLAALIAWRLGRRQPATFSITVNDYGFELLADELPALDAETVRSLFHPEALVEDLLACVNASELARRQFRDIARIAGLVFQGYPGRGKSARQLQASSGLIYDTLARYDPDNRLLGQARDEVLERQLELQRLRRVLGDISDWRVRYHEPERLTPLAFPLWADRLRNRLSTERWEDRVARMVARLEKAAGPA
ncbi:ligase-associated DNA damage response DEXH box helicase [Sediminicurvatus halobius]|uniref:Ligase-associated DNA damage response DEXH box helicase n=1 Tax=Sediminicurvatus halobius TaxID=2182432 RepID=A0A2U2N524_9GAMM|nr:ligase-associated DNA damage response DEXH box helicase [Spiribacter halobius]PWG64315.1 ligase-associated DNA damage response DEXH box helicase [Spiribacter halobius]UEX79342.1 ligase-associated DNA damage response DEXH box helicase [Spiribacter halobius]